VLEQIIERDDPDEAAEFLIAYLAQNEHAEANVGYALGYLSQSQMVAGLRLFDVEHPFFGGAAEAAKITPDQAFAMGQKMGEKWREEQDER